MAQQNDVATFSVAVPKSIAEEVKKMAKREMISVSAVIRRMLADHLKAQIETMKEVRP